jgi:chromosome segregation ATPase
MGKTDELERALSTIKDAENRLLNVRKICGDLDQEISYLINMIDMLCANIKCLKRNRIIAMAKEFKKAKTDLETANTRLSLLRTDQASANKALKHTERFIQKAKENYGKLLRSFDNNVVRGNFRSRNNGS